MLRCGHRLVKKKTGKGKIRQTKNNGDKRYLAEILKTEKKLAVRGHSEKVKPEELRKKNNEEYEE